MGPRTLILGSVYFLTPGGVCSPIEFEMASSHLEIPMDPGKTFRIIPRNISYSGPRPGGRNF